MRECTRCHCTKKVSEFNLKYIVNKATGIGIYRFTSYCRECLNQQAREHYRMNHEKKKQYQRNYNRTSEVYKRKRPARRKAYRIYETEELNLHDSVVAPNKIEKQSRKFIQIVVLLMSHHL